MDWLYFRCAWCEAVHRAPVEAPLVTCPSCGGDIAEISEPPDARWAGEALITRDALEPGTPQRRRPHNIDRLPGPLADAIRELLVRGAPLLVEAPRVTGRDDALAAVLHVTDARFLADLVPIVVERREPSPGTKLLRIDELGAEGRGPSLGLALAALVASARRRSQRLLDDPLTPSPTRAVALRVWLADAAHELPGLLSEHLADA